MLSMSTPPLSYDRILYFKSSRHRRYEQSHTSDTRQYLCWCLNLYETRSGLSECPERSGRSHCLETHKQRSCLVYLVHSEFQCTRLYSYLWMLIGLPSRLMVFKIPDLCKRRQIGTYKPWPRGLVVGCAFYDPANLQVEDMRRLHLYL